MTMRSAGVGIAAGQKDIAHLVSCILDCHDDAEFSWLTEELRNQLKSIPSVDHEEVVKLAIGDDNLVLLRERMEI